MRITFDTSVLVAGLIAPHAHHARAVLWLEAAEDRLAGEVSWHAIAETWSVLTRLPLSPPVSPAMAEKSLRGVLERLEAVPLDGTVYGRALRRCSNRGLRSGVIYDALHLIVAEQRGTDGLLTFNPKDFERLATDASPPILVPPDPPEIRHP